VRLNAEHNQYALKVIRDIDEPLGDINEHLSLMQNSLLQLEDDEINNDAPRFSFEELVLPHDELLRLSKERHEKKIRKLCFTHNIENFFNERDPYDDSIT
jgi:hypothetical protein